MWPSRVPTAVDRVQVASRLLARDRGRSRDVPHVPRVRCKRGALAKNEPSLKQAKPPLGGRTGNTTRSQPREAGGSGFGLLEQLSEFSQQLEESLERLEKSSQTLAEAVAALPASRHDGFGSTAPLEESLRLLFKSKSDLCGSRERLEESKS